MYPAGSRDTLFHPRYTCARAAVSQEAFVPNPALTSPATLAMFEFVGKLMGIALRMKSFLPFRFPSMVRALVCTLAVPLLCP